MSSFLNLFRSSSRTKSRKNQEEEKNKGNGQERAGPSVRDSQLEVRVETAVHSSSDERLRQANGPHSDSDPDRTSQPQSQSQRPATSLSRLEPGPSKDQGEGQEDEFVVVEPSTPIATSLHSADMPLRPLSPPPLDLEDMPRYPYTSWYQQTGSSQSSLESPSTPSNISWIPSPASGSGNAGASGGGGAGPANPNPSTSTTPKLKPSPSTLSLPVHFPPPPDHSPTVTLGAAGPSASGSVSGSGSGPAAAVASPSPLHHAHVFAPRPRITSSKSTSALGGYGEFAAQLSPIVEQDYLSPERRPVSLPPTSSGSKSTSPVALTSTASAAMSPSASVGASVGAGARASVATSAGGSARSPVSPVTVVVPSPSNAAMNPFPFPVAGVAVGMAGVQPLQVPMPREGERLRKESGASRFTALTAPAPSPVRSTKSTFLSRPLNRSHSLSSTRSLPLSTHTLGGASRMSSATPPVIPPIDLRPEFPGPLHTLRIPVASPVRAGEAVSSPSSTRRPRVETEAWPRVAGPATAGTGRESWPSSGKAESFATAYDGASPRSPWGRSEEENVVRGKGRERERVEGVVGAGVGVGMGGVLGVELGGDGGGGQVKDREDVSPSSSLGIDINETLRSFPKPPEPVHARIPWSNYPYIVPGPEFLEFEDTELGPSTSRLSVHDPFAHAPDAEVGSVHAVRREQSEQSARSGEEARRSAASASSSFIDRRFASSTLFASSRAETLVASSIASRRCLAHPPPKYSPNNSNSESTSAGWGWAQGGKGKGKGKTRAGTNSDVARILFWMGFVMPWCWLVGGWLVPAEPEDAYWGVQGGVLPRWARSRRRQQGREEKERKGRQQEKQPQPQDQAQSEGQTPEKPRSSTPSTHPYGGYGLFVAPSAIELGASSRTMLELKHDLYDEDRERRMPVNRWVKRCRWAVIIGMVVFVGILAVVVLVVAAETNKR
ncbi:hypothetical protein CONPUDRAFT_166318 [Coniophora puteana RWD-64-598 SS2]|uniref:Uncharacterized protein n=1 Tax=Coniophora puteana (strain RWD-64-598) TaxID=741705 RepID=A0A5M3MKS0_CONPW|nr:uncharacterized protein CONPUDRAFT_166318 [Coniophora puteana RWD-64-598 SS2]EIW79570.1 hypothetical protein CONPUDRAFT_166318 [Coniophora puteana RWD-64-598 SS2]